MSCIVGTFHAQYHTEQGSYEHKMGIVKGGDMAILAGVGPMGLGAIDYAIHCDRRPGLLVVTDIDEMRLARAAAIYTVEEALKNGVELKYINTAGIENAVEYLISLTKGKGFDDVMVLAPVKPVVEMGDKILARDGCLNFFAGPSNTEFAAELNFYNVHYSSTHVVGTSGGNTSDMIESLDMMAKGSINPASMVTHIGGLNSVVDTTLDLPHIPGGKKLIYTNINLPLTAITQFKEKSISDPLFCELAKIVDENNGLWSIDAEKYLLENAEPI
jgi:threonine dehydrogenase-like Zn-dependent dehydrogenase